MDTTDVPLAFRLTVEVRQNWLLALLKFIYSRVLAPLRSALGRFLAYELEKKYEDHSFLALLKSLGNWLFAYFPPLYLLRFLQRLCSEEPWYPIEDEIVLTTTRVIFTRSKRTVQHICLKIWQRSEDEVCNDKLVKRDEDYLLDGLAFNRKLAQFEGPGFSWGFAKNVYLGIAPITLSKDTKKIRRGRLIEVPEKSKLEPGVKYALIMRCLNQHWRLDYQLGQRKLAKKVSIDFLAGEIARMHRQLEKSPSNYGTHNGILSKLNLNCELFLEALGELSNNYNNLKKYSWIVDLMAQACRAYAKLFGRRYQNGHIKRCHGDLKATNLWVRPAQTFFFGLIKYPQQLLALDCIDFNPEFCHIDTLSDVAMLAIDIEMHTMEKRHEAANMDYGQGFANYFLDTYLRDYDQDVDAWPLLQYYMTEKAMVCAYVSILYDSLPALGEKYLDIANVHAKQLRILIKSIDESPVFVTSQSR
jgi:aminoglycoside phosphotransferase family enzyme